MTLSITTDRKPLFLSTCTVAARSELSHLVPTGFDSQSPTRHPTAAAPIKTATVLPLGSVRRNTTKESTTATSPAPQIAALMIEKFMLPSMPYANPFSLSAEVSKVDRVRVSNHSEGSKIQNALMTSQSATNGARNVANPRPTGCQKAIHRASNVSPSGPVDRLSGVASPISCCCFDVMALPLTS